MDLGLFMMPLHPPEKSRTECFDEDLELVVLCDELNFTEGWIGQHHSIEWEPIPSNDVFIANALPRTKNIRLGTGVSILPQHHPVNVAIRLAFLDHLAHGRFNCGFGQGGVPTDWTLFDLPDPKTQGLMTMEAMDMIIKMWTTEPPFDFEGDYWHIKLETPDRERGMGVILQPYQKPHPPIAMSIVRGGSMAARTGGRRGFLPISTNLVPGNILADHWTTYCAGAEEGGQPEPQRANWRISRSIFIGETTREARDFAKNSVFARSFDYLIRILTSAKMLDVVKCDPDMSDADVTPDYFVDQICIVGDVEEVKRQLHELWDEVGGFGTLLSIAHDWDDREKWIRSTELLAREVVPTLPRA